MIGEYLLNDTDSQANMTDAKQNENNFVQYPDMNESSQNEIKFVDNNYSSQNKIIIEENNSNMQPSIEKDEKEINVIDNQITANQEPPKEESKIDRMIEIAKNAVDTSLLFISDKIGNPFIRISQKVNTECVRLFGL